MSRADLAAGFLAFVLGAAPAGDARAHGLDQREAWITVEPERLVTLMPADAGSEPDLLRELVIRDGEGRRLEGRIASAVPGPDPGHGMVCLEHALDRPA